MAMNIKNQIFWVVGFISLMLDQVTKYWVAQSLELCPTNSPSPCPTTPLWEGVLHLTHVTNPGAAWSLFSQQGGWLRWLSLVVSLGLMALAWFGPVMNRWEQSGYGFILGGALGNGIDRFLAGEVIDFLDFRLIHFPIFNLADVFINVGIVCLLVSNFRRPPQAHDKRVA
jgi:signal peptidase II